MHGSDSLMEIKASGVCSGIGSLQVVAREQQDLLQLSSGL